VGAWELLQQLAKMCQEHGAWLTQRESSCKDLSRQAENPHLSEIQSLTARVEAEVGEVQSRAPAKAILDATYSKLAQDSRFTPESLAHVSYF